VDIPGAHHTNIADNPCRRVVSSNPDVSHVRNGDVSPAYRVVSAGEHKLKGVPDTWRLYRVVNP
jgi:hypothetical protein